jgi:aspartate-semialdehyde dehydrogenase
LSALDMTANVIPCIPGEEDKLSSEPQKIFGRLEQGSVRPADFVVSAQCNRVPVVDGHMLSVSVEFERPPTGSIAEASADVLASFRPPPVIAELPSAPEHPIEVTDRADRPQPARDLHAGKGMSVTVGRIRPCPVLDVKFTALVHNTVRGAAGGSVLNAELLARRGYLVRASENERASAYFGG